MRFRTEIEIIHPGQHITAENRLVSVGSCFSQAIGNRLLECGQHITVTPMGVLFNPYSIAKVLEYGLDNKMFTQEDLFRDDLGVYHALDFESRRQNEDSESLLNVLNEDFSKFSNTLSEADCWLVTFGTAWCFRHKPTGSIVGNCHKLPDSQFERALYSVSDIIDIWRPLLQKAPRVIFTVSPVRHLNDGLHGNTLSKARLHLAIEQLCKLCSNAEYFPAYEALNDDLRDYRFYADDLRHPSNMAEEYIFELFCKTYFNAGTQKILEERRRNFKHLNHRPIINKIN